MGSKNKDAIIRRSDRALVYATENYSYGLEGVEVLDLSLLRGKKPEKSLHIPSSLLYFRLAKDSDLERIDVDPSNPNYASLPDGSGYLIKRVSLRVPVSMRRRPYFGVKAGKLWIDDPASRQAKAGPRSRPRPRAIPSMERPMPPMPARQASPVQEEEEEYEDPMLGNVVDDDLPF